MSSTESDRQLPTLPPEVIARILSIAAAQARVGAGPRVPISPFLRQLALLSKAWRNFGQAELLADVKVLCYDGGDEPYDPTPDPWYRLARTLSTEAHLGGLVKKLKVEGKGSDWGELLPLCPKLQSLGCVDTSVGWNELSSCKGKLNSFLEAFASRLDCELSRYSGLQS